MKKVLLAIGHRDLEEYIKGQLDNDYEFTGQVVYKEGITKAIEQRIPDIIILRETLPGNLNTMSIIYEIRTNYQDIRIIFLAGNREPGDEFLATLVNYGIYDILYGENILALGIINLIKIKNTYNEIKHLQPVPLLDEERNRMLFNSPEAEIETKIIEVTKEVIINNTRYDNDEPYEQKSEIPFLANVSKQEPEEMKQERYIDKIKIPKFNFNKKEEEKHYNGAPMGSSKERIITFVGGKTGVGTTSIAINVAFSLAQDGNKVIFVEFNDKYPAASYWYDLNLVDEGIDTFLAHLKNENYKKLENTIIRSKDIKLEKSDMQRNYKKFPDNIDFLFFSKEYLSGTKDREDLGDVKELFMYLLYQLGYDYVILDVPSDITNKATENALLFSNTIFSVVTPDVSSIGYHLFNLNNLSKKGINVNSKNNYILNRYVKTSFSDNSIANWLGVTDFLKIYEHSGEFIEANLEGLPVIVKDASPELTSSIRRIKNKIQ